MKTSIVLAILVGLAVSSELPFSFTVYGVGDPAFYYQVGQQIHQSEYPYNHYYNNLLLSELALLNSKYYENYVYSPFYNLLQNYPYLPGLGIFRGHRNPYRSSPELYNRIGYQHQSVADYYSSLAATCRFLGFPYQYYDIYNSLMQRYPYINYPYQSVFDIYKSRGYNRPLVYPDVPSNFGPYSSEYLNYINFYKRPQSQIYQNRLTPQINPYLRPQYSDLYASSLNPQVNLHKQYNPYYNSLSSTTFTNLYNIQNGPIIVLVKSKEDPNKLVAVYLQHGLNYLGKDPNTAPLVEVLRESVATKTAILFNPINTPTSSGKLQVSNYTFPVGMTLSQFATLALQSKRIPYLLLLEDNSPILSEIKYSTQIFDIGHVQVANDIVKVIPHFPMQPTYLPVEQGYQQPQTAVPTGFVPSASSSSTSASSAASQSSNVNKVTPSSSSSSSSASSDYNRKPVQSPSVNVNTASLSSASSSSSTSSSHNRNQSSTSSSSTSSASSVSST